MDDPPRYVSAYGDPDDLADEIDRAYGADVARRFRAHIASRDVVDALSGADVAAAVMASRDELAAIADRLRADPALRDAMLAEVERDIDAPADPDGVGRLLRVRDWLNGLDPPGRTTGARRLRAALRARGPHPVRPDPCRVRPPQDCAGGRGRPRATAPARRDDCPGRCPRRCPRLREPARMRGSPSSSTTTPGTTHCATRRSSRS